MSMLTPNSTCKNYGVITGHLESYRRVLMYIDFKNEKSLTLFIFFLRTGDGGWGWFHIWLDFI